MVDKPLEQQRLTELEELFNLQGWRWVEDILNRVYDNADMIVHGVSQSNREFYAGKCFAIKEVRDAFIQVQKQADIEKGK